MKRCAKCNSLMPDDAARCVRCGHETAQTPAPAGTAQPAPSPSAPAVRPAGIAGERAGKRGRIRNGWALTVQSYRVLMLDKQLLVFPLLSGISCLLVMASFAGGIWASGAAQREDFAGEATSWALLFAYYFANYFVIVFFNSALVACAMIRFQGGDPTVRDGFRAARERLAHIAAWALLAATVGVILRIIESRAEFIGRIVIALLGAAWTIATYFVVPVLVVEKLGPVDALKRSVTIIKEAWGESIVSNASVGLITFLVVLGLVVATGAVTAVLAVQMGSAAIAFGGLGVIVVILILGALVGSALNSIVLGAIYLYASEGKVPEAFEGAGVEAAFATK